MPATSPSAIQFRKAVMRIMEERDITITKMAEDLSMSRPNLSRLLRGHDDCTFDRADRISKYLGVSTAELIENTGKNKAKKYFRRSA